MYKTQVRKPIREGMSLICSYKDSWQRLLDLHRIQNHKMFK